MRFIFDCEDEILLPHVYCLIDEVKPFIETMKSIEVDEKEVEENKLGSFKIIMRKLMVEAPKETSKMLSKLWVLEEIEVPVLDDEGQPMVDENKNPIMVKEMEKAPNALKTLTALFESEVAIDFFVSALPSLLQTLKSISPMLKSIN